MKIVDLESEIKLEPNSPLEQLPQCLSPFNSLFNPVLEIKPEVDISFPFKFVNI